MTPRRRLLFLVLVALQALTPLALIGWNEVALARGTEVRLRTEPLDPVDAFRGNYVDLRYEITSIRSCELVRRGQTVYVQLHEVRGRWTGDCATPIEPDERPFIRGRVTDVERDQVEVDYGIETYYIDEREAQRLERRGRLDVDVVLDRHGKARIRRVEGVR